jgi:hypothetical protein
VTARNELLLCAAPLAEKPEAFSQDVAVMDNQANVGAHLATKKQGQRHA